MSTESKPERTEPGTTGPAASRTKVAAVAVTAIAAFFAIAVFLVSPDEEPQDPEQAAAVEPSTDEGVPDALPMVDTVDPCGLSLHDALASEDDVYDGFQRWSDHLGEIALSAPEDVASALDELAAEYASLADAGRAGALSSTASQTIEFAQGNAAASELIDDYLVSQCG